ncbi:hypothetical protein K438DRAFT_1160339 [Mycena galopus ATCC 62051]|nr:hypothetical protein K438DRAFT_1160339 [Mycena galopus ATCC 62051]
MTRGVRACGEVGNPSGMEKSAQTASPSPSPDESTVASTATPSQSTVLSPVDKDKKPGNKASGASALQSGPSSPNTAQQMPPADMDIDGRNNVSLNLNLDPFANNMGLSLEELAEMTMDPEAEDGI